MDLNSNLRYELYFRIQKDLSNQAEQSKNNLLCKMKEILKVWLGDRINNDIRDLIETNPERIKTLGSISLHRKDFESNLSEFKQSRGYFINIKFEREDKIPLLPWIKDFGDSPRKYIDTFKEELLYRELQNVLIEFERCNARLNNFDTTYCFSDYWSNDAETFLQPQKIDTSDQLREEFPEWYYKYFIPCLTEDPSLNLNSNSWESLIEILKNSRER